MTFCNTVFNPVEAPPVIRIFSLSVNSTLKGRTVAEDTPANTPSQAILLLQSAFQEDQGPGRILSLPRPMERIGIVDMQFEGFVLARENYFDSLFVSTRPKGSRTIAEVNHRWGWKT